MIRRLLLLLLLLSPCCLARSQQLWAGLLSPTSGAGACTLNPTGAPAACGVDWRLSGVGLGTGIPSGWWTNGSSGWTQAGSTVAAATCGNGASDCTATIQAALNSCGGTSLAGKYVLLGAGTFKIAGTLYLDNSTSGPYCELRGTGGNQTILSWTSASNLFAVALGNHFGASVSAAGATAITAGYGAGSTQITFSGTHHVGDLVFVGKLNNPVYVDQTGVQGNTTNNCVYQWGPADVAAPYGGSARTMCQIVKITAVAGSVATITPPLNVNYNETLPSWQANYYYGYLAFITDGTFYYEQSSTTNSNSTFHSQSGGSVVLNPVPGSNTTDNAAVWINEGTGTTTQPQAIEFAPNGVQVGVASLQIIDTVANTSGTIDVGINECDSCWESGVLQNFTGGDWADVQQSFGFEIRDNYFTGAYLHTSGNYDSTVQVQYGSSNGKIENNIMERGHVGCALIERGASNNVMSANYCLGAYDANSPTAPNYWNINGFDYHGATAQFNYEEHNVANQHHGDCVWGCPVYSVTFRNAFIGYTYECSPFGYSVLSAPVVCNPRGYPGQSGTINSYWSAQDDGGIREDYFAYYTSHIGDVTGSTIAQMAQNFGGSVIPQAASLVWSSGACSNSYQAYNGVKFGFGGTSDATGGTCYALDNTTPYLTSLLHGWFDNHSGSVTWAGSLTHTLPPSFLYTSRPAWWAPSIPWPAIGPDVSGGIDAGGHEYAIPAQVAYNTISSNTLLVGSPFTTFNAVTLYYSSAAPSSVTITGKVSITGKATIQ